LVERIYREEVPLQKPVAPNNAAVLVAQNTQDSETCTASIVGFRDQRFEPSPLDELSKLVLTREETEITDADVRALEDAAGNVNFAFTLNPLIQGYIKYYQGRGRLDYGKGLRKSGRYMKLARTIFAQEGSAT
jgi:membrane-bound lytic murein transglycosylase D